MKRKILTIILSVVMVATFCTFGLFLTGCGGKGDGNGIEVRISGGTFNDGKTMIKKLKPGATAKIKAQNRLNASGKSDKFVAWYDDQGNKLSDSANFSFTVPTDDADGVTLIGEWEWYGKAASHAVANDKLVAYIEYNKQLGQEDEVVRAHIEKKFKDDMDYNITLKFEPTSTATLGTVVAGELASNNQVDIMVNHWGSDSPIDGYLKSEQMTASVASVLENAPNFRNAYYQYDPDKVSYYAGFYSADDNYTNEDLKGISGIDIASKWGMIMNGTMLDKLYELSRGTQYESLYDQSFPADEFDPTANLSSYFDVANADYKHMTLTQFTNVLLMSKGLISSIVRPFNAAGWCVDYLITPLFEGKGYNGYEYADVDGNGTYEVVPAYATDGYLKLMQYERYLQEKMLWYENPNAAEGADFYALKNIVMIDWPDTENLIQVARQLKGQQAIVIAPLAGDGFMGSVGTAEEPVVVGNASQSTCYTGSVVFKKSTQMDLFTRYLDWMYTPEEDGTYANYELTYYGVEGLHWEKGTEEINGQTYTTWNYTAEKKTDNLLNGVSTLYSKRYNLIPNAHLANYIWAEYSAVEKARYVAVRGFKHTNGPIIEKDGVSYGGQNVNIMSGFNMPDTSKKLEFIAVNASMGNLYQDIRGYAWSPKEIPGGKQLSDLCADMTAKLTQESGGFKKLIDFYTNAFESFHQYRATNKRIGEQ